MRRSVSAVVLGLCLGATPLLLVGCNTSSSTPFAAQDVILTNTSVTLSGANEVPPITSAATGTASASLNVSQGILTVTGTFSNLSSPLFPVGTVGAGHVHVGAAGANGPVKFMLMVEPDATGLSGTFSLTQEGLTAEEITEAQSGLYYINLHSQNFNSGELRGQITFN
ncbi:MAG: hypothetical protein OHK0012_20850 [Synechococcales cyanobacterium]